MAEGNLTLEALAIERGQDAELDEELEAVADAEHKAAGFDEALQAFQKRPPFGVRQMQPALRRGLRRSQVVPVKKTAREDQN